MGSHVAVMVGEGGRGGKMPIVRLQHDVGGCGWDGVYVAGRVGLRAGTFKHLHSLVLSYLLVRFLVVTKE
jgi:hypothetical protein